MLAAYAARQSADDPLSGLEVGEIEAPATPDGWVTGPAIAQALYASYNPGTRQFAHSTNEPLGWV